MLHFLRASAWVILLAAVVVAVGVIAVDPTPPRELTLLTVDPDGALIQRVKREKELARAAASGERILPPDQGAPGGAPGRT